MSKDYAWLVESKLYAEMKWAYGEMLRLEMKDEAKLHLMSIAKIFFPSSEEASMHQSQVVASAKEEYTALQEKTEKTEKTEKKKRGPGRPRKVKAADKQELEEKLKEKPIFESDLEKAASISTEEVEVPSEEEALGLMEEAVAPSRLKLQLPEKIHPSLEHTVKQPERPRLVDVISIAEGNLGGSFDVKTYARNTILPYVSPSRRNNIITRLVGYFKKYVNQSATEGKDSVTKYSVTYVKTERLMPELRRVLMQFVNEHKDDFLEKLIF